MKKNNGKLLFYIVSALLVVALLTVLIASVMFRASGSSRYFSGDAERYCNELKEAGFPDDYAVALTELHLLHPTWSFTPLLITGEKSTYTWEYIIDKETEKPDTNLISPSASYQPYRHETNTKQYDSGYYQASRKTVEYFMDPRNFLNETDIFQFYDLRISASPSADAVEKILDGTFMKDAVLENGLTYAAYFLQIGNEVGIDPAYLAAKARTEQGVDGTSPVISGTCGTLLAAYYHDHTQTTESGKQVLTPSEGYDEAELAAYDGYYNVYNIGASGNGLFAIYRNAMKRAVTGSASMSEAWDGSPSWDTLWKSIAGGAYFLKNNYIDRYQSTIYLQKFNVDSRAGDRNFDAQYMQNVSGAMTEARILYSSFASIGALDTPCGFLIPVYGGMPSSASRDPADGKVSYLATADRKFDYSVTLMSPEKYENDHSAVYLSADIASGATLVLAGSVTHSYGVSALEYRWDDGAWQAMPSQTSLDADFPVDFSDGTSHILVVRGRAAYDNETSSKKCSYNFLCAVIYVRVVTPQTVTLSVVRGDRTEQAQYPAGKVVYLPVCLDASFAGWLDAKGALHSSGERTVLTGDTVYTALDLRFEPLEGAAISTNRESPVLRFYTSLGEECDLPFSRDGVTFSASVTGGDEDYTVEATELSPVKVGRNDRTLICADTLPLSETDCTAELSVRFSAKITYPDGSEKTIVAEETSDVRCAADIAFAALEDADASLSPEVREILTPISNLRKY